MFNSLTSILLMVVGLAAPIAPLLADCAENWEVPEDHFDGVNEAGSVSYWDKIGEIDIGEKMPFPIVIGFQSDRERSSPYLGVGWIVPLLESYVVQTGEDTFQVMKPTGYTSGFGRDPKSPAVLGGVKDWKGTIGAEMITLWAPCGWKLTFNRGKLSEIGTPRGKKIILKRDRDGTVEDVTLDSRILVKTIKGIGGKVEGLEIEGRRIAIEMTEKPRIKNIQGINLIERKDIGVSAISSDGTQIRTFDYSVDTSLTPRLKIYSALSGTRSFAWNAVDGSIISDNDWTYKISKLESSTSIERARKNGAEEYWQYDPNAGKEISKTAEGITYSTFWFTSGPNRGKLRREVEESPGTPEKLKTYAYDEKSQLIRATEGPISYFYDHGKIQSIYKGKKLVWQLKYDAEGKVQQISSAQFGNWAK